MATFGVSGPSYGLSQFLSSLATSGSTPSRLVGTAGAGASVAGLAPAGMTNSPNGPAGSAASQSRPQQLAALIQTTVNTLNSDHTGNPLDALRSIEQSPGLAGLLGQLNVNPQQFRSDVLSAMSQSSTGTPDFSQIFQNFPTGQSLNTLA